VRFQTKPGYCGATVVVNVLRTFGIKASEKRVASLAGTTIDGTDEHGIITALRSFGLTAEPYNGSSRSQSWTWLHGTLVMGKVVVLCVDNSNHWVAIIGTLLDRVVLIDSTCTRVNKSENGVHVISSRRLLRRWTARDSGISSYYGIGVGKR
jgi:ABC-type bacteriocin/lantibiotic exporter with double-glycine peptidase domain